jgi:hypothetical protein
MIVRAALFVLGLFHLANGVWMLAAPSHWFLAIPGVTMTGPFNPHFVLDVGMAFVASGAFLMLGARRAWDAPVWAMAGATWPALHALIHIDGWAMHGIPRDPRVATSEVVGVVGLAFLGVALALLRRKGES